MAESPPGPARSAVHTGAPAAGATAPAVLLVALTVLSPWPFGSVPLRAVQLIALLGSACSLVGLAAAGHDTDAHERDAWSRRAVAGATALWSLGLLQLVP